MNEIEKKRKRIDEIAALIAQYGTQESLTPEDVTEIDKLDAEFENLKKEVSALEKIERMTNAANASAGRQVQPTGQEVKASKKEEKTHGWKRSGEFFQAVARARGGSVDNRLKIYNEGQVERFGEEGGFLVPEQFDSNLQKKVDGDMSLLSRCNKIPMSSNSLRYPTDEIAPWDGSGITAKWVNEEESIPQSKHKFKQTTLQLEKLAALVKVTEELLEDQSAIESIVNNRAGDAMVNAINSAIIRGDGVGKPHGILDSTFAVEVAKESGQTADTVNYANIVKMYSRALPISQLRGVWLINAAVQEQLRLMEFRVGSNTPVPVYLPAGEASASPFATLMGRPVIPMMASMSQLGDKGDIIFADLNYYDAGLRSGESAKASASTHVNFDQDKIAYKFTMRMDGRIPYETPVTTEYGSYSVSGIVTLADR